MAEVTQPGKSGLPAPGALGFPPPPGSLSEGGLQGLAGRQPPERYWAGWHILG